MRNPMSIQIQRTDASNPYDGFRLFINGIVNKAHVYALDPTNSAVEQEYRKTCWTAITFAEMLPGSFTVVYPPD
jgi:hypothetical protein